MTYFVYLIRSRKHKKTTTYVGYTNNLKKRLAMHNSSKGAKFTRGKKWKIAYYKNYDTKKEAMIDEYKLKKNKKFREKIKNKVNL